MKESTGARGVKFDLRGVVTVRLIGADDRDARTVERQLGPIKVADDSKPADITIRFVDEIATTSPVRYVGLREVAFTDDAFLVLRAKHKAQTRTLIPMDQIGGTCEIVCERGTPAVPLLLAIINLTAASKGVLALHAGAFEWRGRGTVVTGWSKGGKTETLLAFMRRGARYIADEWCYIDSDGNRIFGVPEPVRLWHWQLRQLPEVRKRVAIGSRIKMSALGLPSFCLDAIPRRWQTAKPARFIQRLTHFAERYRNTLVAPERLFCQPVGETESVFDRLVFVMSAESAATVGVTMAPEEAAERMAHSLKFERQPLEECYRMYRFAFPHRSNPFLEKIDAVERRLLASAFAGKPTICVEHPYPVSLEELYNCLEKFG